MDIVIASRDYQLRGQRQDIQNMKGVFSKRSQALGGWANTVGIGLILLPVVSFGWQPVSKPRLAQEEIDKIYREQAEKTRSEQLRVARTMSQATFRPLSQTELESLVIAQNKTYPKTSPEGMRIDRSSAGPGLLTYYKNVVDRTADEFDINRTNFASYRPAFVKDACANAGVANLLNSGISVKNVVRDRHGKLIYEFTVRPADCAR